MSRRCRILLILSLILALALAAQGSAFALELKSGMKGSDVKKLQTSLKQLGFYTKSLNSKYDKNTEAAVKQFQLANGLTADGVAGDALQQLAASGSAVSKKSYILRLTDAQCVPGGSGEYVKQLKNRLKTLKYLSGKIDDKYDENTRLAVADFQRCNALIVTGVANAATRDVLYGKKAKTRAQYESSLTTPLKKGNKGEAVSQVQTQLQQLGYYTGSVTGTFSTETVDAVKLFQLANGIKVSGTACRTTRTRLNAGTGISKAQYDELLRTRPLKYGDSGAAVKVLQERLATLGYYTVKVNSKYDKTTREAVKKFQLYNNLPSDGAATATTRQAMNANTAKTVEDIEGPKTLKPGATGEDVKRLERTLIALGYYTEPAGGKYDSKLTAAVKLFQKAHGFAETGTAYSDQRKLMESKQALSRAQYLENERVRKVEIVVSSALAQLGKPYVWGASGMKSFDCTGLTCYAYNQVGIKLNRSAHDQGYYNGVRIAKISDLKRGDIVIFDTVEDNDLSDHAGIYLGNGDFVHASSGGKKVMVSTLKTGYYNRVFSWGLDVWPK